jgi:hypothetical protein
MRILFLIFMPLILLAQSGREYERYNILNKNLISTVFTNGGVIGHPVDKGPRGAWIEDNNGYVGDVSPFVGCEIPYHLDTDSVLYVHSVTYCLADKRPNYQEQSPAGEFWGFRPLGGYFNEQKEGPAVAIFTDPTTWPLQWPDRLSDTMDPGWPGQWNGYFGKDRSNATEETYFAMDDNNDEEFNIAAYNSHGIAFAPDSTNPLRYGLGLQAKVRAFQWKKFLAQDCIFWLYKITNEGTTDYNKANFGMLVGTYVGVTSTEDVKEYDDDWSFFDAELDVTFTGDYPDNNARNPLWVGPVGMVGYAFLESPGNKYDGIDNDNDADANFTTAPFFQESDFDTITLESGDKVVLIDKYFERRVVTVYNDTTVTSQSRQIHLQPGVTRLVEGNVIIGINNRETINPNALDGLDNDLDGLIDENYYLHYYQRRQDPVSGQILINKLRPLRHKDYIQETGLYDLMIDESRSDLIDNDGDWDLENDDVGLDGVPKTQDPGEEDGMPTSGEGTGLNGEPNIDLTDVDESDQIGLTSFDYFVNAQAPTTLLTDDEALWVRTSPGNFDVPSSIVNNQPIGGEDGDFFYASGYFPLLAGQTESFSLALVYGGGSGGRTKDTEDLLKNRQVVQKIYNSNYQFPKEPDTPTLTAEIGDGKVILTWDRTAESSFDPVLKEYDFEGYRLYKSTDPKFNDIRKISDADGKPRGYVWLAQWDLNNDVSGYFHGSQDQTNAASGYSWFLGNNTGLQHYYLDIEVENGRRYYYALTAYDRGKAEEDIDPSESPFLVTVLPSGEIVTGKNSVSVIPGTEVAGYIPPGMDGYLTHTAGPGNGRVFYQVLDEKNVTGSAYEVEFFDTGNDGLDNNGNWNPITDDLNGNGEPDPDEPNVDENDNDEIWPVITTSYNVRDLAVQTTTVTIEDTIFLEIGKQHLIPGSVEVRTQDGDRMPQESYLLDYEKGRIKPARFNGLAYPASYTINFEYYPVYRSSYIGTIQRDENQGILYDTDHFDGLQLSFYNYNRIELIDSTSGWLSGDGYPYDFTLNSFDTDADGKDDFFGKKTPNNFRIDFYNTTADSSLNLYGASIIPVNFKITNTTLNIPVDFAYVPLFSTPGPEGYVGLSPKDEIYIFEKGVDGELVWTWFLGIKGDSTRSLGEGEALILNVTKPFRRGDLFTFVSSKPEISVTKAKSELDRIRVVPNPYIAAHEHEAPLPPLITSGRGERKITFTHLPQKAIIKIFTVRGEHVITIDPHNQRYEGTATWNLKNKDNLDVAYGIYFYVIDSPVGKKRGKIGIIK